MAGNIRARAEGLDQGRHPRRILARRAALTFAAALLVAAAGTAQTASEQELDAAVAAIRGLKDEQRFDDAHTRFAAIVDRTPDRGIASAWLFFEGAEIRRRLFDWQQSMAWLDRTEAALVDVPPSPDRTTLATLVSIGRASVQIERGLPDLAHAHLQAAQAMAPADDRFLGNRITWLELRMHRALEQGQAARDCLQGFERKFGPDAFLRLTAAVALMQDPRTTAAELAQVDEWIDAARTADLSADERSLVSTLYVLRRLATRDHGAARSELDAALQRLPAGVNERRVSLEALALRLANDAGDAPERVRDRQLQLRSTWDQLLDKLAHQPPAAMGLGAMFPLERQRALAEMIRSHLRHDGVDGPRLALQLVLDIGTLGSLARTLQAGPCTVADVQRSLTGPGRGLLVYAPGPERSWAFVVDAHAVQTFELGVRTST
ncbi:MAG: hypothetical protein JNK15_14750, partial [Planctomycetes bacterium]|nr:hypothetical protein [Planctomycetota bacterium]